MKITDSLRVTALLCFVGVSLLASGCGEKTEAEGIEISVSPSEALIGPGPDASCLDRTNFLRAVASGSNNTSLNRSVVGPVVGFQNFKLVWKRSELLYVQGIRVNITGQGIQGGSYKVALTATEIENLLARLEGIVEPAVGGVAVEINSADSSRESNPSKTSFAACGLRVGQIPLVDGNDTFPFTATVEVEVIGTAEAADGTQKFVRARTKVRAKYYGS